MAPFAMMVFFGKMKSAGRTYHDPGDSDPKNAWMAESKHGGWTTTHCGRPGKAKTLMVIEAPRHALGG